LPDLGEDGVDSTPREGIFETHSQLA